MELEYKDIYIERESYGVGSVSAYTTPAAAPTLCDCEGTIIINLWQSGALLEGKSYVQNPDQEKSQVGENVKLKSMIHMMLLH
jgi:hypothetical protein